MKYSPAGRRFSLPTFDIFGQPMFEPFLYYNHFHPYHPPPPPPPFPHPSHYGYQYPPELYSHFNIPEALSEQYFSPSNPDTNPFPNSPTNQHSLSREINPDITPYGSLTTSSHSSSPTSPSSSLSSSSSPDPFSFAESVPSFDVSRAETPGECYYRPGIDKMVVRTIPHPDTVQMRYDGQSMKNQNLATKSTAKNPKADASRALVVNGSTNEPFLPKAPKEMHAAVAVNCNKENLPPSQSQTKVVSNPNQRPTPVISQENRKPAEQARPVVQENDTTKDAPSSNLSGEGESACVHIALNHLPIDNQLNAIRLRANYTTTANKPKLIEEARSIFTAALRSRRATELVELGIWFSWTERGVNINFKTNSQRWLATDNSEWLSEIGESIRITEKWGGIVVRDIWNPYILENAVPSDSLMRRLEQLNVMTCNLNESETIQEPYRIRKIRWFGPSTLAIWFHNATVSEYFAQKGVWFMDGFVGTGKQRSLGVCGLSKVYLLDQSRTRMSAHHHHVRRQHFAPTPVIRKEGCGGQHERRNGEAKGYKVAWHQKHQQ